MSKMRTIADLVKEAQAEQGYAEETMVGSAHAQGMNDANRVVKVASYTGEMIGKTAFAQFHDEFAASLGFAPEDPMVKQASIYNMLECAFEKIAENYSPQSGGANLVSTNQAAMDQLREEGKTHAFLAMQAANDAVASVDMGDANTAAQSMATAGQNINLAKQVAGAIDDPELQAQVAQASQAVATAAQTIQAHA